MTDISTRALIPMHPWPALALAAAAAGVAVAGALGAPIWTLGIIGLAPVLPILAAVVLRVKRLADGWLAVYLALVLTQVGHVGEHLVQVTQLRVLGLGGRHAHGVFGALDIEWVHFAWNAWILLAVVLLLVRFATNAWLWVTLPLAAWHLGEHVVLIAAYVATGTAGNPGLLAMGGLLAGGLPVARPELHFAYNLAETIPLVIGLAQQWRHSGPVSSDVPAVA